MSGRMLGWKRHGVRGGAWLLVMLVAGPAAADPAGRTSSLRLLIELPSRRLAPGTELGGRVSLRSLDGSPAMAPRALTIRVETQMEGDTPRAAEVGIAAGEGSGAFTVRAERAGMVRVRATHPELMEADTYLRCAPLWAPESRVPAPDKPAPSKRTDDAARPHRAPASAPAIPVTKGVSAPQGAPGSGRGSGSFSQNGAASASKGRGIDGLAREGDAAVPPPPPPPPAPAPATPTVAPPAAATVTAPPPGTPIRPDAGPRTPSAAPAERARVMLRLSPQRAVLADGKDAFSVLAFLDRPAPSDLRLNLLPSIGRIEPRPLVIPRGETEGVAIVTGQDTGAVRIELVNTDPVADVDGERTLSAQFAAPVAVLDVSADPKNVTFVEMAKVTVQLHDEQGRPVATDEPRVVDLTLDQGHGTLERERLTIDKGQSEASSTFAPTWPGPAGFSASSPSLFRQSAALRVTWPVGLLVISLLGGVVGGALALLRNRRQHLQRIATGGVTGFVLYWTFIAGLLPVLPRGIVLNPLSVFTLSTLGGWMGTEVFGFLLRKLGVIDGGAKGQEGGDKGGEGGAGEDAASDEKAGSTRKAKRRRAGGE